jgi:hypothetical protein
MFLPSSKHTSLAGSQRSVPGKFLIPVTDLVEGRPSKSTLESGQACYASELVAQGVSILVFARHEVEARAAGGGEDQALHPLTEGDIPGEFPQLLIEAVNVGLLLATGWI